MPFLYFYKTFPVTHGIYRVHHLHLCKPTASIFHCLNLVISRLYFLLNSIIVVPELRFTATNINVIKHTLQFSPAYPAWPKLIAPRSSKVWNKLTPIEGLIALLTESAFFLDSISLVLPDVLLTVYKKTLFLLRTFH